MNVRSFKLINGNNDIYDLNDMQHWLHNPSGLGLNTKSDYTQIGGNFVRTNKIYSPDKIGGTVMFTGENVYEQYRDFIRFIQIEPLNLIYNNDFKCDVDIESISKSEIDKKTGSLMCPIRFFRKSRWFRQFDIINDGIDTDPLRYEYVYDYRYTRDFAGGVTLYSDSIYESPVSLAIYGRVVNPSWDLELNGVVVATGKVDATIEDGEILLIDAISIPYKIVRVNEATRVMSDMYQYSDFTTKRFMMLGNGKNSITVRHEGEEKIKVGVTARVEYESV